MRAAQASAVTFAICALLAAAHGAAAAEIDPATTRIGFTLKTRWGQVLRGRFPTYTGQIEALGDGRHRVRLVLSARDIEIVGHPNYTGMTRGDGFFQADRYPQVSFVSDPYPLSLLEAGGRLGGELTIRDVRRRETFTVVPATCDRPARDCDVVAGGSVRRSDYGVDRWVFAVSDIVRFDLRLRLREGEE